jgi:sugar phosphate isomerase/epimerase
MTHPAAPACLRDRIGIDLGRRMRIEDGIGWARAHDVRFIDIQMDTAENAFTRIDAGRASAIRAACEAGGIQLGLHTLSAVNVAEYSPFVAEGVDRYLEGYVDVCAALDARWIVVHAGYHFGKDKPMRMAAGLERLKRVVARAEAKGVTLLLENLNKEPDDAEVQYLAHTLEEWRYYTDRIISPRLRLSFTANHAHLEPEGIEGFVAALDFSRVAEVRLADCFRNGKEEHLVPGQGNLDFGAMFRMIEAKGFTGHYTNAFGTVEDMLAARDTLVVNARAAGVDVGN